MEDRSAELAARRQTLSEAYRLVGQLEQALTVIDAAKSDSTLPSEIAKLQSRIREIERIIDPRAERERMLLALSRLRTLIGSYAKVLTFERSDDAVTLNTQELTVRVATKEGRNDFLWEIGSGANWLGLHLSTLLALHEYLWSLRPNVVPNFLVIDQPSQVYFPERWPGDPDPKTGKVREEETAETDIDAVKRIFRVLSEGVKRTEGSLQVIVTDHAGTITWEGVDLINVVDQWRGDRDYLIPRDWYTQDSRNE